MCLAHPVGLGDIDQSGPSWSISWQLSEVFSHHWSFLTLKKNKKPTNKLPRSIFQWPNAFPQDPFIKQSVNPWQNISYLLCIHNSKCSLQFYVNSYLGMTAFFWANFHRKNPWGSQERSSLFVLFCLYIWFKLCIFLVVSGVDVTTTYQIELFLQMV